MNPLILDLKEKDDILYFTIANINVSYANAIRRVILSDIPTIVFETLPHEKNKSNFYINTSKLNNEILKQRLACIPVHISDLDTPIHDLLLEVDIKNDSENIIYVTTNDFKIKNNKNNKYLNDETVKQIFPPDKITNHYIDFCRLNPKLSDNIPGEYIKFNCEFSVSTAKNNYSYNVVSTCSYKNSPDYTRIEELKVEKKKELEEKYEEDSDINYHLMDWLLLDAKRIFIENSFDFIIETIGVYSNREIVIKAINILIDRLKNIIDIYSKQNNYIINSDTTIPYSYDIIFENEDYTIGKILEFTLYDNYYMKEQSLTFCGFQKPHPHINISIIRLGFKTDVSKEVVIDYLLNAANIAILFYNDLLQNFNP